MNKNEIRLTIKDEMKNKISMALKDPILQQGFEIICKENAELKKENQKWKDGIALKDEEIGCIETDFNTFKSKAKELLKKFMPYVIESYLKQDISNIKLSFSEIEEAEQFLKENK